MLKITLEQGVRYAAYVTILLAPLVFPVSVRATQGQAVILSWDTSTDPTVAGYTVYYGNSSRTYTTILPTGALTTAIVSNLASGATYYFAATTHNAAGLESAFSAEVSYAVPSTNQPPTLDPLSNLSINRNSGMHTVALSGIASGNTGVQTLTVSASSSNPEVVSNPSVTYSSPATTGSLAFSTVPGAYGSAVVTVIVDNHGTNNNTVARSFTVNVINGSTLQANSVAGPGRSLTVSGNVGSLYQIQYCTNLTAGAMWYPLLSFTQTSPVQSLNLEPLAPLILYRIQEQAVPQLSSTPQVAQ